MTTFIKDCAACSKGELLAEEARCPKCHGRAFTNIRESNEN